MYTFDKHPESDQACVLKVDGFEIAVTTNAQVAQVLMERLGNKPNAQVIKDATTEIEARWLRHFKEVEERIQLLRHELEEEKALGIELNRRLKLQRRNERADKTARAKGRTRKGKVRRHARS